MRLLMGLLLAASVAACSPSSTVFDGGECPEPPALAAGELTVALSCAEEVVFEGRTYSVSGGRFHESWVGERIADQGETNYEGAYALRTFSSTEVIALRFAAGQGNGYNLAFTEDFETDFGALKEPFGAHEKCPATEASHGVSLAVQPCSVQVGTDPKLVLRNDGEETVSYGPPFKLQLRDNGRWRWINRKQAFILPLYSLAPGERKVSKLAVYFDTPDPITLKPGRYRVIKEFRRQGPDGEEGVQLIAHFKVSR